MKIHRFIMAFDPLANDLVVEDRGLAHQMGDVLKLKKGERVVFCDGQGKEVEAELTTIKNAVVTARVLERRATLDVNLKRRVKLYCSLIKRDNFEWVVAKATEVGVTEIIPLLCARTIKTDLNTYRLSRIIKEAAEQSGRGLVPSLQATLEIKEALVQAGTDAKWFCHVSGSTPRSLGAQFTSDILHVFVGPEGGWLPAEIDLARQVGCEIIRLGDTVLRAETAAVIAGFLAINFK